MNNIYYTYKGNTINLGNEIGHGGEGKVYLIHGYQSDVAKIYIKQQLPEVHRKILAMIQNPPHDPTINGPTKHRSIAWPSDILYLDRQKTRFAGFIMPRIDMKIFIKLLNYISPDDRVKKFQGGFTWLHLFTTAFNISSCLAAIHERGYCVGDINESNILVAPTTPLTIIDCDSFQVNEPSSNKVWRCKVGKVDYTAPEILDYRYEDINRTKETDCFALAIIIFQLLMEGFHPYAASGKLVDDAPTTRDKIRKGIFPYTSSMKGIAPPHDAPPFDILHPEIQTLFHRCFHIGHKDPAARPSAKEWMAILKKIGQNFKKCPANENHRFLGHLTTCPWCDRAKKTRKDSFPSPVGQQIILPDPTNQTVSLDDRKAWLLPYIEMALVDGYISPEEEEYLIDQGLKLLIPEKETKRLITGKTKQRGFTPSLTPQGVPKLEIVGGSGKEKRNFKFEKMRLGTISSVTLIARNGGGGTLDAKIETSHPWLIVNTVKIHQSKLPQTITITVDPRKDRSKNTFGGEDKGNIEITYQKGSYIESEKVYVEFSIEMPEAELSRFRRGLTFGGLIVGGLFGYFIYNVNLIQGMNENVAGIAGILALIGTIIVAGKLGYQDGGGGAAFGWGCGTLIAVIILLVILESYFPHALSTVSWTLTYASFANLLSTPMRKSFWRGNLRAPIVVGAVTLVLTGAIIMAGFVSAKEERKTDLARSKAKKKAELSRTKTIKSTIRATASELPGEWHGKVGNSTAILFITGSNRLSGKMEYQGVEEKLSIKLKNTDGKVVIILKGTSYKRLKGKGRFNLDTFYATLLSGGDILKGNYVDTAKKRGRWSVSKVSSGARIGRLFIETEPAGARIRVLNIRPNFYQGMGLYPGRYHVEVSSNGYKTKKMWIQFSGEDRSINIRLVKIKEADTFFSKDDASTTNESLIERKERLVEQKMEEKSVTSIPKHKETREKEEMPAADDSVPSLPPPPTY